jgi:hypothetical protein
MAFSLEWLNFHADRPVVMNFGLVMVHTHNLLQEIEINYLCVKLAESSPKQHQMSCFSQWPEVIRNSH